jgi:hypothetical protein
VRISASSDDRCRLDSPSRIDQRIVSNADNHHHLLVLEIVTVQQALPRMAAPRRARPAAADRNTARPAVVS